jgi:hypothetical protein
LAFGFVVAVVVVVVGAGALSTGRLRVGGGGGGRGVSVHCMAAVQLSVGARGKREERGRRMSGRQREEERVPTRTRVLNKLLVPPSLYSSLT